VVNSNTVVLKLAKKKKNSRWADLVPKDEKFKPEAIKKNEDPNASLMNMMKKMYEEGDDNMKRTIAEAWTKSKDGKAEQPQP
jgi:calcyclin binding protein